MKKLALATCAFLAVATLAQAGGKEVVGQPKMTNSKEVVAEPVPVVETPVVVEDTPAPVAPIVAAGSVLPWGYVNVRAGGDFWSRYTNHDYMPLKKDTEDWGYEFAVEGYKTINDYFDLGLGVAYQDHAQRKGPGGGVEYKSVPVYLTAKYKLNYFDLPFTPYIKANGGYSFNFDNNDVYDGNGNSWKADVKDGAYWAAGLGAEYNNFTADVMYGVNYAKASSDYDHRSDFNNDYQRVTLSLGYKFNID